MMTEIALILPPDAEPTADPVAAWRQWMENMAERELARREEEEGVTFTHAGERAWAHYRLVLAYAEALNGIADTVRLQALAEIARQRLFEYSPEGWESLSEVIEDAAPSYASRGTRHQLLTVAEVVAPFCDHAGIPIYKTPIAPHNLGEAASALAGIIRGPGRAGEKVERVAAELDWLQTATRQQIRDRYRNPRGTPGRGIKADLPSGATVLMVVADPDMAAAIQQKVGRLVGWSPTETVREKYGPLRSSKVDKGQAVRRHSFYAGLHCTQVFDAETGELVEEIG